MKYSMGMTVYSFFTMEPAVVGIPALIEGKYYFPVAFGNSSSLICDEQALDVEFRLTADEVME